MTWSGNVGRQVPKELIPRSVAAPSPWVIRFLPLLRSGGSVLDIAAGGGRHVAAALAAGFDVVAVDRDITALRADFAGETRCRIETLDLEDGGLWHLGQGFDGIIVTNYLYRPLLPALAAALAPGGVLLYETFMVGNERFGKPTNPAFLLAPGELARVYGGLLTIVAFEEGETDTPRPAVVQRLAASRPR